MKRPRRNTKKSPIADAGEARFAAVVEAFAADSRLAAIAGAYEAGKKERRRFGSNGLKLDGKIFAMLVRGRLVVKLPKERVDLLVASRQGERFDPGHGRLMKEWVTVGPSRASWVELAMEAHRFVKAVKP
jgi:hypothetical protein